MVVKTDFQQDQRDFYDKYHTQFDPEDENKLEYTPIYEKFVEIMEKLIEAKLKAEYGYTDEEIEAFYEHFKVDAKEYEAQDVDTVDILYSMVDFVKFKKSMISYVKGTTDLKATDAEKDEQNALQTTAGNVEEAFEDFKAILAEPLVGKESVWKKKSERLDYGKHGWKYVIHQKSQKGKTDMLRIDASFKGIKKEGLMKYFLNPPPDQQAMMKEMRDVE